MFAQVDPVTVVFGSLGGVAALVMAINTWLLRREAAKQKVLDEAGANRMDTFEKSQSSLQAALARADTENERLRTRMSAQDTELGNLRREISTLRDEVEELRRGK